MKKRMLAWIGTILCFSMLGLTGCSLSLDQSPVISQTSEVSDDVSHESSEIIESSEQAESSELPESSEQTESSELPESSEQAESSELTDSSKLPESSEASTDKEDGESEAVSSETESNLPPEIHDAKSYLASMTLEEKIYQLFVVRPETLLGVDLSTPVTYTSNELTAAIQKYPVGGVALFGANIQMPGQTIKLIDAMQEASKTPLFISVDEEGGLVARLGNNSDMGTTAFPNMMSIGNSKDPQKAYQVGFTIGSEIKTFGFNLDFAPVADCATNPKNSVIGNRSFSSDPEIAAQMVASAVKGFTDAGIIPTLKHFPGHGDTAEDSHTSMAITYKTLDEMRECEFVPFAAGIKAGADMVMAGHITAVTADASGLPATLSKYMLTDILRGELGFNGVIITDAMEMGAITQEYSIEKATVLAIKAGVDIILMPKDLPAAVNSLQKAVASGEISEARIDKSVMRILKLKEKYGILS